MRTIYIDADFKCHVAEADDLRAVETDVFDGKCDCYVEGFRFVPEGEAWTRSDGVVFPGEMISPWKDYEALEATQRAYESSLLAEYEALIDELYTEVTS